MLSTFGGRGHLRQNISSNTHAKFGVGFMLNLNYVYQNHAQYTCAVLMLSANQKFTENIPKLTEQIFWTFFVRLFGVLVCHPLIVLSRFL